MSRIEAFKLKTIFKIRMKINYLITYDVRDNHEQIIADLLDNDWHSVVPAYEIGTRKPVFCYLPETSWIKAFDSADEAIREFKQIAGKENILRFMVTVFTGWQGSISKPKPHQVEKASNMRLLPALN